MGVLLKKHKTAIGDEIRDTLASVAVVVIALTERINTPELVHILMNKVTTADIKPIYTSARKYACN